VARVLFALLGFAAVVTEIATLVERDQFVASNFFSFFTIQSNLLGIAALLLGAYAWCPDGGRAGIDLFRGAATLYMVTTGIVFSLLLAGLENTQLTAVPWDNTVLHYVMPVVLAVDWLVDRSVEPIPFRRALVWLVYPIAYLAYTLIRGPIVDWYPYPFLNADEKGYGSIAVTSLAIAAFAVGLAWVLAWTTRWGRPADRR
jgi:hypothetical protein